MTASDIKNMPDYNNDIPEINPDPDLNVGKKQYDENSDSSSDDSVLSPKDEQVIELPEVKQVDQSKVKPVKIDEHKNYDDDYMKCYQPNTTNNPLNMKPDHNTTQKLDENLKLSFEIKIKSHILCNIHFFIRIAIFIILILLMILSTSYALGAVTSTQLIVVQHCPEYTQQEIWENSARINSSAGDFNSCWSTSKIIVNGEEAFEFNEYESTLLTDELSILQCGIFSLLACFCLCVVIYSLYSLIKDMQAIHKQTLYLKAPKMKNYLRQNNGNVTARNKIAETCLCVNKYFGIDSKLYIFKMILLETAEIIVQTFALLLYNGYDVFDPYGVHLATKPRHIYLFAIMLSLNSVFIGILWLFYVLKQTKCNGLIFKLL
eukprot:160693_1